MAEIESINGNPIVAEVASESIQPSVDAWLAAHPEATTTVEDGSVTDAKLVQSGGILDTVASLADDGIFHLTNYAIGTLNNQGAIGWGPYCISSDSDCVFDYPVKLEIADGYNYRLLLKRDGSTYSDYGYGTSTGQVIPAGMAFKVTVRRTGDTSTPADVLLISKQLTVTSMTASMAEDASMAIDKLKDGRQPLEVTFMRGVLVSGTGAFNTNSGYRVATPYIEQLAEDTVIYVADGFKFGVMTFDGSGTYQDDSGWVTSSYAIAAGQRFRIQIAKTTESTSTPADVYEFAAALSIDAPFKRDLMQQVSGSVFSKPYMMAGKPKLAAHAGYKADAPENTIPAFMAAGKAGMWAIETDVNQTSDGKFVCIHDTTLDRTTTGTGNISDKTLAQIRELSIKGHPDLKVPTLDEYLGICKAYGCVPFIEIKGTVTNTAAGISAIIDVLEKHALDEQTILIGSKWSVGAVRGASDTIPYLGVFQSSLYSDYAAEIDFMKAYPNCGVSLDASGSITDAMIETCHANGMPVCVFTVDNADAAISYCTRGVDIITTDYLTNLDNAS